MNSKTLNKRETARIVGIETGQMTGVRMGGEVGDGAERGCEILCIFSRSTAMQSILSEVLGMGGKSWTREG